MAGFVERVQIIVEAKTQAATSAFKDMKTSVAEADGVVAKAKAGFSGLGSVVGGVITGPAGLAAVGTAVVGFAAKAVGSAEDLDLAVGKLRDSTGLSADAASRWVDEGEKMGVSSDTLATSFGKLEKAIGANPDKIKALGVQLQYASDGSVDVNGTLLAAIDTLNHIEDPAQRATVAAQLFGKGWQSMSELIDAGSSQVKADLAATSGAELVSDDQIAQGRALRDSMHDLGDAIHGIGITIGQDLIPGIAAAASGFAKLLNNPAVKNALDIIGSGFQATGEVLTNLADPAGKAADSLNETTQAASDFTGVLQDMSQLNATGIGNLLDTIAGQGTGQSKEAVKTWQDLREGVVLYAHGLEYAGAAAAYATHATDGTAASTEDLAQAQADQKAATDLAKTALDLHTAALERNARIAEQRNQIFDAATSAVLAQTADQAELTAKTNDFHDALKSGKKTVEDRTADAIDAAKAALQLADDQATAAGKTLDADAKNKILIASLKGLEAQASGPTATAIQTVIDQLNNVPPTVNTTMEFNPDQQDLEREQAAAQHWLDDNPATLPVVAKLVGPKLGGAGGGRSPVPTGLPGGPAPVQNVHVTVNAGVGTDAFALQRAVTNASRRASRLLDGTRMNGHRR